MSQPLSAGSAGGAARCPVRRGDNLFFKSKGVHGKQTLILPSPPCTADCFSLTTLHAISFLEHR